MKNSWLRGAPFRSFASNVGQFRLEIEKIILDTTVRKVSYTEIAQTMIGESYQLKPYQT